jgi:hypothetical protein
MQWPHPAFRLPENLLTSYPHFVTTAAPFRTAATRVACDVPVAGVPWPVYKLLALAVALLVLGVVAAATASAAPSVLAAAAAGTVVWLTLGAVCSSNPRG